MWAAWRLPEYGKDAMPLAMNYKGVKFGRKSNQDWRI